MYGTASAGTAGSAGALAMTGAHIESEIVLALGLIFMGAALVRASIRRRPHRP